MQLEKAGTDLGFAANPPSVDDPNSRPGAPSKLSLGGDFDLDLDFDLND